MRLAAETFAERPWRIHELTPDFRLEDLWGVPGQGAPDDFARLIELIAAQDPEHGSSATARALWSLRWKLGDLLGLDGPGAGLDARVPTLRDRLPADLQDAPTGPEFAVLPFRPLYLLDDEFAAEIANGTMHGVMHVGRVAADDGRAAAELAVLVKPNGRLGNAYMAAIRPFRHLVVYPAIMRDSRDLWERAGAPPSTPA
jgi:hypothetical protein